MKAPRYSLFALALIALPSSAHANAGTPLMWASMLHLVIGNALIGVFEGLLLSAIFKCPKVRAILLLIVANYASAWGGNFLLSRFISSRFDITIQNFWSISAILVAVAFLVTLLIEFPFFWFALRSQQRAFLRTIVATILIHGISYALLFGWYRMASATSLMTQLQVVSAAEIVSDQAYALFSISPEGNQVRQTDLKGEFPIVLTEIAAHHNNDRLFVRANPKAGYDLYIWLDSDERDREKPVLIAENFSRHAPDPSQRSAMRSPTDEGTWFNFGEVPSLAPASQWQFFTGFWASEGLVGTNQKTGETFHIALETPFASWIIRNATQLDGDLVVFQLGRDQICILHPPSKRIALIARGKGPIVALPSPPIPDQAPLP